MNGSRKRKKIIFYCTAIVLLFSCIFTYRLSNSEQETANQETMVYVDQTLEPSPTLYQEATEPKNTSEPKNTDVTRTNTIPEQGTQPPATQEPEKLKKVTLVAVGDDLVHIEVVESGKQNNGEYNFDHLFEETKEAIAAADIAVINQETIFAGEKVGYAGYPRFNSPQEVGDALVEAGFDVVLHATNHAMDKGEKGLRDTMEYWKTQKNITVLGVNETIQDQDTIKVVEKNGIKIAMLNYTYCLNGKQMSPNKSYMVNMLDKKQIIKDITRAKEIADFVIVYPHWGKEYSYTPSKSQREWTKLFVAQEVDLVIGSHPHVLEPVEWLESKSGHKTLVYYSLGNFISFQKETPRMLGGMAKVTLEQKEGEKAEITEASITPLVTHFTKDVSGVYTTYQLEDYTQALAKEHKLAEEKGLTLKGLEKLAESILADWYE